MYKLIIQDDEGKTTVVPLIREELTIGRQEGNTIRLTERNVSRKHAKLLRGTEEIIIEDLDSYNGVRVNGSRIQGRAEIKEADRVQIGDYLIEVKADQPNADAETREIAVIPEADVPAPLAVSASEAATVPTSIPVSTPPPAPAPAPASAAVKANGTGPNIAASIVTPDEHSSGRLVILSKTMAGREFVLDKPAMVIGRTEENDIWVNHRSISRHHAKVVRENGSYAIVDLQSANGVRVNGEEYGKVELRTRDVVDLGHVRFRFVAPDEDFLFGRDAQPVDIATEGQSGKLIWAALGLLLIGVVAFVVLGGDKDTNGAATDTPTVPGIDDPPKIDDPPVLPAAMTDAATGSTAVTGNDKKIAILLGQVEAVRNAEQWPALRTIARDIQKIDPDNEEAKVLLARAAMETTSKQALDTMSKWAGKKNSTNKIATEFAKISEDSDYYEAAEKIHTNIKDKYADAMRDAGAKKAKDRKCTSSDFEKLGNKVPKEWSELAAELQGMKCKETRTASNDPVDKPPVNKPPVNKPPVNKPPSNPDPATPTLELLEQAELAVRSTQFGKGERLCRQVLDREPGNQRAITACAIAACNLRKASTAKKFIRRIKSSQRRQGLKQICTRLGNAGFEDG
jgi:pSer/pThr/pTyr-binding forkhead associated (FHA) protein